MGDPETQSVLTLMESDLVDLVQTGFRSELDVVEVKINQVMELGGNVVFSF